MVEGIIFVVGTLVGWIAKTLLSPSKPGAPYLLQRRVQRQLDEKKQLLLDLEARNTRWQRSVHVGSLVRRMRLIDDGAGGWEHRNGRVVNIDGDYVEVQWTQEATSERAQNIDFEERVAIADIERDHAEHYPDQGPPTSQGRFFISKQPNFPDMLTLFTMQSKIDALDLKRYRMRKGK